jgi:PAS domain S-box-containing protein
MRHAIVTVGSDSRIEHWNDVAEDLFGYRAAEVIGELVELLVERAGDEQPWSPIAGGADER